MSNKVIRGMKEKDYVNLGVLLKREEVLFVSLPSQAAGRLHYEYFFLVVSFSSGKAWKIKLYKNH